MNLRNDQKRFEIIPQSTKMPPSSNEIKQSIETFFSKGGVGTPDKIEFLSGVFAKYILPKNTLVDMVFWLFEKFEKSDNFVLLLKKNVNLWKNISKFQILDEEFIEKYRKYLDWSYICSVQRLNEEFIEKILERYSIDCYIDFHLISQYQCLSEKFIEKYLDRLNLKSICEYNKLSDSFMFKHKDILDWNIISNYQELSVDFIEKMKDYVNPMYLMRYQEIESNDIERLYKEDFWIMKSIKMASVHKDNWRFNDVEFKKQALIETGKYECYEDYFIAYKAIRIDGYSLFNFQHKYDIGTIHESNADYNYHSISFGLSASNIENALEHGECSSPFYKIIKVKIYYEDIARIISINCEKPLRCKKLEVLEIVWEKYIYTSGKSRLFLNGEFCEIDNKIIDAIELLNKKQYNTLYCCSGHIVYDFESDKIICMQPYITFSKLPKYIKNKDIGKHWSIRRSATKNGTVVLDFDCNNNINFNINVENGDEEALQKMLDCAMLELKNWATEL